MIYKYEGDLSRKISLNGISPLLISDIWFLTEDKGIIFVEYGEVGEPKSLSELFEFKDIIEKEVKKSNIIINLIVRTGEHSHTITKTFKNVFFKQVNDVNMVQMIDITDWEKEDLDKWNKERVY